MIGKKRFEPKMMYKVSLEDLVPADNFYRKLESILDLRFVYSECRSMYGRTGNASIDPAVFFKIILFGYFENIISDRELIRRASDSLGVRLYLGYDIDEELPWHSTISRTRAMMPKEVFEKLFNKILMMCIEKGLVSGEIQAIDSTLVKANASLEKIERKGSSLALKKYIDETRKENSNNSKEEEKDDRGNKGDGRGIIGLIATQKKGVKATRSNKEYESKSDPDSRIAKKPGKPTHLSYMVQYSVDSKAGVITDASAVHADTSDKDAILEIIDKAEARLNKAGLKISAVAADKNYSCGRVLRSLEKKSIEPFIPSQRFVNTSGGIDKREFVYDKEKDEYKCPANERLKCITKKKDGSRDYKVKENQCVECRLRSKCVTGKGLRKVSRSEYEEEYQRLAERIRTPKGRKMCRIRKIRTEPLFAEGKMNHGLSKFMTRGIGKARKNTLVIATVQNLKRLMKFVFTRRPMQRFNQLIKERFSLVETPFPKLDICIL